MVEIFSTLVGATNWGAMLSKTMYWIGYGLFIFVVLGVFYMIYYFMSFPYKAIIFPLYGSANEEFAIGRPKHNRIKWNKTHTAWKKFWPLFSKKEIEPFNPRYIFPGKRIFAFELDNEFIPATPIIRGNPGFVEFAPKPYYIRNWQSLEHKRNAIEFSKQDWWSQNKFIILTIIVVAICAVIAIATVYMSYKFAAPTAEALKESTNAFRQFVEGIGSIGGQG